MNDDRKLVFQRNHAMYPSRETLERKLMKNRVHLVTPMIGSILNII
jgi:hypothetical protein